MHRLLDWLCGVMVSTGDSESPDPGSLPGMTSSSSESGFKTQEDASANVAGSRGTLLCQGGFGRRGFEPSALCHCVLYQCLELGGSSPRDIY